jgi:hypothetical protein
MNQIVDMFGIKSSAEIPIDDAISKYSDMGSPIVEVLPESAELSRLFLDIT